jgi:hypothetical protein
MNSSAWITRRNLPQVFFLLLLLSGLLRIPLHADVTATVSGTITDHSGALIAGATIDLRQSETGITRSTKTNGDGFYSLLQVSPGHYDITVTQPGFSVYQQNNILLDVNSAKIINVVLSVNAVNEKVVVDSSALGLETARTEMGDVIDGQTIVAMPLETRSYTDLLALQPGVAPVSSGASGGGSNQFQSSGFAFTPVSGDLNAGNQSVNGQREGQNGFLLNGTTVQEYAFSGTAAIPNLDSIAEFRILTNNFDAEYGNYPGGQINVITKSGTNQYHGSAFEFLRNTDFDGRNFFATQRDDYQQNQFGVTAGGPVKREKLFFFADYQGNRVVIGQSALGAFPVPTAAERAGDFSDPSLSSLITGTVKGPAWASQLSSTLGKTVIQGEPYYFSGCNASNCVFPGAQVPQTAFSAPTNGLMSYIPPINLVTNAGTFYSPVALPERINDDKTSGRLDYNAAIGTLSAYYFFDQYSLSTPNALTPEFGSNYYGTTQVVNLSDIKTLGTSAVNELRFGFVRLNYAIHVPTGGNGITPASLGFVEGADTLGISPSVPQYAHVPEIDFSNFSIGSSGSPLDVIENTFQWIDNYSKILGTHTMKAGGVFRYNQLTEKHLGSNGDFGFNGSETGLDFVDFLIGAPASYSQGQGFPSYGRGHYIGLFAQDSWRARSNLTLNYGLRWDVSTPWAEQHNEMETLVPGLQSLTFPGSPLGWVFPGDPGIPKTLAPTRYNNFAPRVGLAYAARKNTLVRANFGLFYSTFEGATTFNENGDAPFGNYYGSPVPPEFATPFVDRGTGNIEGQRFPVAPPPFNASPKNPDDSIIWANFLPISSSPGFWYKNVLPYTEEYSLSVEQQINKSTVFSLSYVGNQAHHLLSSLEANPGSPSTCLALSSLDSVQPNTQPCGPNGENGVYYPAAGGTVNGTRAPFGNDFGSNGYFISAGKSSYNSLQASLQERTRRLTFLAGYTFSKSLDNASGYGEQINVVNPRLRSLSAFNVAHSFVISYNLLLPTDLLPGPRPLTNGWRLSGITRFATGQPVTMLETDDQSLLGTSSGGAMSNPIDTPNFNGESLHFTNPRSGQPWFDVNAFSQEPLGELGNAGRRFFGGPGLNNFDVALLKDTQLHENVSLQFRTELFNAFNHTQFGPPNGNINGGTSFGLVTSANDPRIMQLSLKLQF